MVTLGIAIPTKNRVGTLGRTIEVTLEQMPDNCCLHVLDNGSDDGTAELLSSIDHPRFFAYYDEPGTPAYEGFVRVLSEASRHDYAVLMSDEDEVVWSAFPDLVRLLTQSGPSFVSTAFRSPPHFTRSGRDGCIAPNNWFAGSFYCSGLVYKGSVLLAAANLLNERFADSIFLRLYPQSGLQLVMMPHGGQVWSPVELCRARETQDTSLFKMDDGSNYWEPANRRKKVAAYLDDLTYFAEVMPEHKDLWVEARNDAVLNGWT
jgi:glycosyltransferase involved in cell wall biosynthesis